MKRAIYTYDFLSHMFIVRCPYCGNRVIKRNTPASIHSNNGNRKFIEVMCRRCKRRFTLPKADLEDAIYTKGIII